MPVSGSFEEYCALAEFVAEDSSQVSFKAGDKVVVMSKDDSGQCVYVRPSSYVADVLCYHDMYT